MFVLEGCVLTFIHGVTELVSQDKTPRERFHRMPTLAAKLALRHPHAAVHCPFSCGNKTSLWATA